ncbi:MAG: hypothetical protein Q8O57_10285 [Kiritimatiellota bacterium]|nr:hypothetical protein [Kiritimatiellota bacterium]
MADPKPAAGGSSGSASASSGPAGSPGGSGASHALPWYLQVPLDMFGHKAGDSAVGLVKAAFAARADRQQKQAVRLPNFAHILVLLQTQNPIAFAQIRDLMQFLGNDKDQARFQYHVAGIGGDTDPQPSVDFLIRLAGEAKSTGQAGLQEMRQYLLDINFIGIGADDPLAQHIDNLGKFAAATAKLPGKAKTAVEAQADSAATALSAAVTATGMDAKLADAKTKADARLKRAQNRWK